MDFTEKLVNGKCFFISFPLSISLFSPLSCTARYNFTNVDEPYFVLDMLELMNARLIEENDSVLIVVYAVNQKGRSIGVVIRDLELGATVKNFGNEVKMQKKM